MTRTQNIDPLSLDRYIEQSGLKIGFITDKLGISRQAFDKKRKNVTSFTAAEVYVLRDLLKIPDDDVAKIFCF